MNSRRIEVGGTSSAATGWKSIRKFSSRCASG